MHPRAHVQPRSTNQPYRQQFMEHAARWHVVLGSLCAGVLLSCSSHAPEGIGVTTSRLEAKPAEAFAEFSGAVTAAAKDVRVRAEFAKSDFVAPACGSTLVAVVVRAADGSLLDPGQVDVLQLGRKEKNVTELQRKDILGKVDSFALAHLGPGAYDLRVKSERKTTGSFTVNLFLAGDVDGDWIVTKADLKSARAALGAKRGSAQYIETADVDQNGKVENADINLISRNVGASTSRRVQRANPLDELLPPGSLKLVGRSAVEFNPVSSPLRFELQGAEFSQASGDVTITINGSRVADAQLTVTPNAVEAAAALIDGKNELSFVASDRVGRPLYLHETLWAGSSQLQVTLATPSGAPVTTPATVTAKLSDDNDVHTEATSTTGTVTFQNVPRRTILLEARGNDNSFGTQGIIGNQGAVQIVLSSFHTPSSVNNNDFSSGTDGWEIGGAPVSIVSHVEGPEVPANAISGAAAKSAAPLTASPESGRTAPPLMPPAQPQPASMPQTAAALAAALVDNDLALSTGGEGEQRISRTFQTATGTTAVRLRYRFVTTEVPGGYFGSQFNDYYAVSIRTQSGGTFADENNSMNGLGLGAFDYATGTTAWRDLNLTVDPQGDTIQVDLAVANVGDGAYPSQVIVDFVQEERDQVRPSLAWDQTNGGLSLSYEVVDGPLQDSATIAVNWASGSTYASRIGAAVFSYVVPAGTTEGSHDPVHISGDLLADDPAGTTHLVASSSPASLGAVTDVRITYGAQANAAAVWSQMVDIVKDGLRAAGQSAATITSTARAPEDQARAMFNNLVNTGAATQLNIYGPAGDAVINVFVAETAGMTPAEIQTNAADIRAAMVQEIENQGPSNVSRHCANPTEVSVVDVGATAFNNQNGPLFVGSVQPRVTRFIDERQTNSCYHLEVE